jgi:hypothetical protein
VENAPIILPCQTFFDDGKLAACVSAGATSKLPMNAGARSTFLRPPMSRSGSRCDLAAYITFRIMVVIYNALGKAPKASFCMLLLAATQSGKRATSQLLPPFPQICNLPRSRVQRLRTMLLRTMRLRRSRAQRFGRTITHERKYTFQ